MRSYVKSVGWQVSGDINNSFVKDHPMIDHLPVSDLILKLYTFDIFFFGLPPFKRPKWFPFYVNWFPFYVKWFPFYVKWFPFDVNWFPFYVKWFPFYVKWFPFSM